MNHEIYMRRALVLAERGAGRVAPGPLVGCVIVKGSRVIGEGWHDHRAGRCAELSALESCTENPAGATLYTTLEPCRDRNTAPCLDAIFRSRVASVVVGSLHPDPGQARKGSGYLLQNGYGVEIGVLEAECRAQNEVYFHFTVEHTPFVVMKYAMTLDGKLPPRTGGSQWVAGAAAREHVQKTRTRLSAVMIGVGTVLTDDPPLAFGEPGGGGPLRVICDSHLRTPPDSSLIRNAWDFPTLLICTKRNARAGVLEAAGAEVLVCDSREGRVDLHDLMRRLAGREIDSVLLEGGAALQSAALAAGIVRKVQAYVAPRLGGGAGASVSGVSFGKLQEDVTLRRLGVTPFGEDILIEGEVAGRNFLQDAAAEMR